jgi:hypothetical protein
MSATPSQAHTPVFDVEASLASLADTMARIGDFVSRIDQRLTALESKPKPSTAKPSPSTAPAPKKAKGRKSKKEPLISQLEGLFGPHPTPSTGVPAPTHIRTSTLGKVVAKLVQEKTSLTLIVPDDQAGHVVGRAGSGLKQIHDISSAKVSVSPTVTAGFRTVSIRGTDREVGDALAAIGKRLARRRLRTPKKKVKKEKAPFSGNPFTAAPPPTVVVNAPLPTTTSTSTSHTRAPPISRASSQQPHPTVPTTLAPNPISPTSTQRVYTPMDVDSSRYPGTPMDVGALTHDDHGVTKRSDGRPSARRSRPYRGGGRGRG